MMIEEERGLLPAQPKRKKPFVVLYKCSGGGMPRTWRNWATWKRYRTLKEARQAVHSLVWKWNGSVRPDGPVWEFKLAG